MARPTRMSLPLFASDRYATLRSTRAHDWPLNAAAAGSNEADLVGGITLVQTGSPNALNPGRTTSVTGPKYFVGDTSYNMDRDFTLIGWINRPALAAIDLFYSTRFTFLQGQITVNTDGANKWVVSIMDNSPGSVTVITTSADTQINTYTMLCLRHTKASKTLALSIDNGRITASNTYTNPFFAVGANSFPQLGREWASTYATHSHRGYRIWHSVLSAADEALMYAGGSSFLF